VQASLLLEEGLETARFLRDASWANVSVPATGTTYYLTWSGTNWATSTTANVYVDGRFERTLRLDDVYRDGSDDIVPSGGTLDVGTRKATVTVSWWDRTATSTRTISTYLTNIF